MQNSVSIIDYGMGNRRSVEKAFEHIGAQVSLTSNPKDIRNAHGIVIPGVGAFAPAMQTLHERGLDELICERSAAGVPLLGICLGMQLLFESSEEGEPVKGLGLIEGSVVKLASDGLKLPHIGWNRVCFRRDSPLRANLVECLSFYHVHSFTAKPKNQHDVLALGEYGQSFVSIVEHEHLFGVQFHAEKSSHNGLQLLKNFVTICTDTKL
jgi:glutamine amidotransferase